MSQPIPKFAYGVEEAAEALGVSRSRAFAIISSGELQSYKDGRRRLVSARALEEYIARKERESQGRVAA